MYPGASGAVPVGGVRVWNPDRPDLQDLTNATGAFSIENWPGWPDPTRAYAELSCAATGDSIQGVSIGAAIDHPTTSVGAIELVGRPGTLAPGQMLRKPQALFIKLEEGVVEEELARMGAN